LLFPFFLLLSTTWVVAPPGSCNSNVTMGRAVIFVFFAWLFHCFVLCAADAVSESHKDGHFVSNLCSSFQQMMSVAMGFKSAIVFGQWQIGPHPAARAPFCVRRDWEQRDKWSVRRPFLLPFCRTSISENGYRSFSTWSADGELKF
jgi:hypothetical protein